LLDGIRQNGQVMLLLFSHSLLDPIRSLFFHLFEIKAFENRLFFKGGIFE
jgi:hypothetical protein